MNSDPFATGTLACCAVNDVVRVVRIASVEAHDATATVVMVDGKTAAVSVEDLQELTQDMLRQPLFPDDDIVVRAVLVAVATATFTQTRITPAGSAATVGVRALNSSALPAHRMARLLSEFALPVAADGNAERASELACEIAEALTTIAAASAAVSDSIACVVWCTELLYRAGGIGTPAGDYIADGAAAKEE